VWVSVDIRRIMNCSVFISVGSLKLSSSYADESQSQPLQSRTSKAHLRYCTCSDTMGFLMDSPYNKS
jgi:hypothetical protein